MNLDKYQENVNRAKSNRDRIAQALAIAEAALLADPDSMVRAADVITYTAQAKAAEAGVKKAENELEMAERKANSPETKAELKELDRINKAIEKKLDEVIESLTKVNDQFDEIQALHSSAKAIARKYDQKPFDWEKGGMLTIREYLFRWMQMRSSMLRMAARPHNKARPANPRQALSPSEHEKMLRERYPKKEG